MAKKQASEAFADIMGGANQPLSANNEPEKFIPFKPGDKYDIAKKLAVEDYEFTDPYSGGNKTKYGGKYMIGSASNELEPQYVQGENQPGVSKTFNNIVGNALSVFTKLGTSASELFGGGYDIASIVIDPSKAAINKATEGTITPNLYENVATKLFKHIETELIKEKAFPVYGGRQYSSDSFIEQLGDGKTWADFGDSVAFSLQSYAPVLGIPKMLSGLKLGAELTKKLTYGLTVGYNTISESALEASDMQEQARVSYAYKLFNKPYEQLLETEKYIVNQHAGGHAASAFRSNLAVLGLSNLAETYLFMGSPVKNAKKLIRSVQSGKLTPADISVAKNVLKDVGIGVSTQGPWEEGMQTAIQNYENSKIDGSAFLEKGTGHLYEWINNFYTAEGQKAMAFGAMLGGGMGIWSGTREAYSKKAEIKDYADKYQKIIAEKLPLYDNTLFEHIKYYHNLFDKEVTDKDGNKKVLKSLFDEDGSVSYDIDKITKGHSANMNHRSHLDNLGMATLNKDDVHAKFIINESLAQMFYSYMTNEAFTDSDNAFEVMMERKQINKLAEDEEYKNLGYGFDEMKSLLDKMKREWDASENTLEGRDDLENDKEYAAFKRKVKKGLFYEKMRLNWLDEVDSLVEDKESITKLREDAQELIDTFENKKERVRLYEAYNESFKENTDLINQLAEEEKKDPQSLETKRLKYLIKEQQKIKGNALTNGAFTITENPAVKTGALGLENEHFYNIGADAITGARLEAAINKGSFIEAVDILDKPATGTLKVRGKYDVTKEDIEAVKKLISIEEKNIEENKYTAEQHAKDSNDIMVATQIGNPQTGEVMPFEEGQAKQKEIDELLQESQNREAAFKEAKDRLDNIKIATNAKGLLNYKDNIPKLLKDNDIFNRKVADEPVEDASNIQKNFNAGKESYDQLKKVEKTIADLKSYIELYTKTDLKERLNNKAFKGYIESLKKAISALENNVLPKTKENFDNNQNLDKKSKKNRTQRSYQSIGISIENGTIEIIDQELYDRVRDILTPTVFDDILKEAKELDSDGSEFGLHEAFVTKIVELIKASDRKGDFIKYIQGKVDSSISEFSSVYDIIDPSTHRDVVANHKKMIGIYTKNPKKVFQNILQSIMPIIRKGNEKAIDKYINNNDVYELKDNLEDKDSVLSKLIGQHIKVEAFDDMYKSLISDIKMSEQVEKETQILSDKKIALTNQQTGVLRDVVRWFNTAIKTPVETDALYHKFKNWLIIKGVAGSGKSFIVDYLRRALNLSMDEIYTIVPHVNAANVLNEYLSTEDKTVLIDQFNKDNIKDNIKVIIIDEAAALTNPQISKLAGEIRDINNKRKDDNKIRVIGLADPNQIAAQEANTSQLIEPIISDTTMHPGTEYMEITDPLTVRNRSLVPELNEILDIIEGNENKIEDLVVSASAPTGNEAIGIHVGNISDLKNQLNKTKSNGKSKAIVVFSEKEKEEYQKEFSFAEVFTFINVAGTQFQEVFVALSRDNFRSDKEFNKAYYTAASRAKEYAFLYDKTNTFKNSDPKPSIKENYNNIYVKDQNKIFEQRKVDYVNRLEFEKTVLGGVKYTKKPKTAEEVIKEEEEVILNTNYSDISNDDDSGGSEVDSTDNAEPIQSTVAGIPSDKKHDLLYPSHEASKFILTKDKNGKERLGPRLIPDGEVIYLKCENKKGPGFIINVLGQLYNTENKAIPNVYAKLAVLSEEEYTGDFGEMLVDKANNAVMNGEPIYNDIKERRDGTVEVKYFKEEETFNKTVVGKGLLYSSTPLSYTYANKPTKSGNGLIDHLMELFSSQYLNRARERAEYKIEMYTPGNLPNEAREGLRYMGVPYLVIKPISSKGKIKRTQYIRLNPRNISKDHKIIKDITSLTVAVENLTNYLLSIGINANLGDTKFNTLIKSFASNYHILNGKVEFKEKKFNYNQFKANATKGYIHPVANEEQYNGIASRVEPLIKLLYGNGKIREKAINEAAMIEKYSLKDMEDDSYHYRFVPVKEDNKEGEGYVYRYAIGEKESKGEFVYEDGLVAGEGDAQSSFNVLAKANEYVADTKIRTKILKYLHASGAITNASQYITSGKSILSTENSNDGYYRALRKLLEASKINLEVEVENKDGKTVVKKDNWVGEDNYQEVENIIKNNNIKTEEELNQIRIEHSSKPITLDVLKEITNITGDRHSTLRTPLKFNDINKLGSDLRNTDNVQQLEDLLETNIEGINQTKISVRTNESTIGAPAPKSIEDIKEQETVTDKAKKAFDDLIGKAKKHSKFTGGEDKEGKSLVDKGPIYLGRLRTQKNIRKLIKKSIPGITDEEIQFVTKKFVSDLAKEEVWGHYKAGILYLSQNAEGRVLDRIARHEVFHKIWNEYLTEKERKEIREKAKEIFADYAVYPSIEELLAVKYHGWKRGIIADIGRFFTGIFNKIARLIGIYNDNMQFFDELFSSIDNGMRDYRVSRADGTSRSMLDINKKFGGIDAYIAACNTVLEKMKEYRMNGINDIPSSKEEILEQISSELKEALEYASTLKKSDITPETAFYIKKIQSIYNNFNDIQKDLFIGFSIFNQGSIKAAFDEDFEIFKSEEDNLEEGNEEGDIDKKLSVNLNKHIADNESVNPEDYVVEEVKEWSSYIENENGNFLSWRYVFLKMISLFEGLNFEADNIMAQIEEAFLNGKMTSNENAILKAIKDIHESISTNTYSGKDKKIGRVKMSDKMKFIDQTTFIIGKESVEDVANRYDPGIINEDENGNTQIELIEKKANESTSEFLTRIAEKTGKRLDYIAEYKRKQFNTALFTALVSQFNSFRQRDPMIGEVESAYGGYEIKYKFARGGALVNGLRSTIQSRIANMLPDKDKLKYFVENTLHNIETSTRTNSLDFIKQFLNAIGLKEYAYGLTNNKSVKIKTDIITFFNDALKAVGKPIVVDEDSRNEQDLNDTSDTYNDTADIYTMAQFVRAKATKLNRLVESISLNEDLSRTMSSTDANGERRYNAVMTSSFHKRIFNIINSSFENKSETEGRKELRLQDKLNSKFWKKNIFLNGINNIYRIIDHDGIDSISSSGISYPKMYASEKRKDYNFRSFVMGFISGLNMSQKHDPHYIQYLQPSERKTPFGIETKLLDRQSSIKAIESIIEQLRSRDKNNVSKYEYFDPENTIGFSVIRDIIGDKELSSIKKSEINSIANQIYLKLNEMSQEYAQILIEDKTAFDNELTLNTNLNAYVDKLLYPDFSVGSLPKIKKYLKQYETNDEFLRRNKEKGIEDPYEAGEEKLYLINEEHIAALSSLFFINNYINSYSFTQLAVGDTAIFENSEKLTKRLSIALAPGKAGFVNDKYGIKKTTTVAVIDDPIETREDILKFLQTLVTEEEARELVELFPDDYQIGDGAGYMLPERLEDLNIAYSSKLGNMAKGVYYSFDDNGISHAIKYNSIVLSDEFVAEHPALEVLRNKMRMNYIDGVSRPIKEVIFKSSNKVGVPSGTKQNKWYDLVDEMQGTLFNKDSLFEMDNRDYRIQLDPASEIDSHVSLPTQMAYLIKLFGINDKEADEVYNSLANIVLSNSLSLNEWMKNKSLKDIIANFISANEQHDLDELLSSGVDINFPSIVDKVINQYISTVFNRAVKIKFDGSKLVLQSSLGVKKKFEDAKLDLELPESLKRELRYKRDENGNLYAECIVPYGMLPKHIEAQINQSLENKESPKDHFYFKGKWNKDLIGFRIPASELHSTIPIKVAGFYDSKGTNIVIAPKQLVALHGSDFDVDSLFVLKRSYVKEFSKDPVGYSRDKNGNLLFNDTTEYFDTIDDDKLRRKVIEAHYLNKIIEEFIMITSDEKNVKRMLSPINFDVLSKEKDEMKKYIGDIEENLDPSNIIDAQKIHDTLYSSETAIGMFATQFKAFSYLLGTGNTDSRLPVLRNKLSQKGHEIDNPYNITFNGEKNKYNSMLEISKDGQDIGTRFDSLMNAALDNLKVMILPYLNASRETIRSYSVLVMHGVPFRTINNYMNQPILRYLTKNGRYKTDKLFARLNRAVDATLVDSIDSLYDKDMTGYLSRTTKELDELVTSRKRSEEDEMYLAQQVYIYELYKDLNEIGGQLSKLSKLVNVIRAFPNNISEMEDILSDMKSIMGISRTGSVTDTPNMDKSDFPYDIRNFYKKNQHVYRALAEMQNIVNKVNSEFIAYGKQFRHVSSRIAGNINIRLDKSDGINKKKIRDEFHKFLMTSLIDRSKIKPYTWYNIKGEKIELDGMQAFNRAFINLVKEAKHYDNILKIESEREYNKNIAAGKKESEAGVKYEGNQFLNVIQEYMDPITGRERIIFGGPTSMNFRDTNLYREAFKNLDRYDTVYSDGKVKLAEITPNGYSDFQRMFVTYAMANYGMSFGLRNYSKVLPGDIYKDVSDKMVMLMHDIDKLPQSEINSIIDAFEIQLVSNYPDSLVGKHIITSKGKTELVSTGKVMINGVERDLHDGLTKEEDQRYGIMDKDVYYDRMYTSNTERTWPLYNVEKFNDKVNIFRRITNNEERSGALYVKVGTRNRDAVYNLPVLNDIKSYDPNKAFYSLNKIKLVNGYVSGNKFETANREYNDNDLINVTDFRDPAKVYPTVYRIVKRTGKFADKKTGVMNYIYEVQKHDTGTYKSFSEQISNESRRIYDELNKYLRSHESPFRAGKLGRIYFRRGLEAKGRSLRLQLNKEVYNGWNVIKERVTGSGWQVWVDIEEIEKYVNGKQLDLFAQTGKPFTSIEIMPDIIQTLINKFNETTIVTSETTEERINEYRETYNDKDVTTLLDDIEGRTKSKFTKILINFIRPYLEKLQPEFMGDDSLDGNDLARFYKNGKFVMDYTKIALQEGGNGYSIAKTDRVILHELIHGITIMQLGIDLGFRTSLELDIQWLKNERPDLYNKYKNEFDDVDEFVSELLSNEEFFNDVNSQMIPSEKRTIIGKFIEWLGDILGFNKNRHLGNQMLEFIKENIKPYKYAVLNENGIYVDEFGNEYKDMPYKAYSNIDSTKILKKLVEDGSDLINPLDEDGNQSDKYTNSANKIFHRVTDLKTGFISLFRKKGDIRSMGEREADYEWGSLDKTIKLRTDKEFEETYEEYKRRKDKEILEGATKGRIIDLLNQRFVDKINTGGLNEHIFNSEIQSIAYKEYIVTDSKGEKYGVNIAVNPDQYDWFDNNVEEIYKAHGINIFDKCDDSLKDKLATQVGVSSDLLGFAGMADLIIEHSDGTLSIKDLNAGSRFDNSKSNVLLKYGDQDTEILDRPRHRKKFQIMVYAFITKLNNPDVKFRDLSVMWVPNKYYASHIDKNRKVEVADYLRMIESFFKDKAALREAGLPENIYETLIEKSPNLFYAPDYTYEYTSKPDRSDDYWEGKAEDALVDELVTKEKLPDEIIQDKLLELQKIIGQLPVITELGKSDYKYLNQDDRIKVKRLTHQILQGMKDPYTSLQVNAQYDISLPTSWIGNYSDVSNPHVQVWNKFNTSSQQQAGYEHEQFMLKWQSLYKAVEDEYYKANPNIFRSKRYLNHSNYAKRFAWAYKEYERNGVTIERYKTKNDEEFKELSKAQQDLLNFTNDYIKSWFEGPNAYMNQVISYVSEYGELKPVTALDIHNRGLEKGREFKYEYGWFPKPPQEESEIIFEAGRDSYIKGLLSKKFFNELKLRSTSFYLINNYEGRLDKEMVLPLKYMGNFIIDSQKKYTRNMEFQMDRWVKTMTYKKNMDPVYALGEGVKAYLEMSKDRNQPMYTNTVEFLDKKITSDVLGRMRDQRLTRKSIRLLGTNIDDKEIRLDAVLLASKNWVSATTMWLKPFTGTGNGIHANLLKHKEGLKGTVASFMGIDGNAIDYTLKDSLFADDVYFREHTANAMQGKLREDKTFLMLRHFRYLPDNFDYRSSPKYLMSTRNRIMSESTMYSFHSIPEEFVAITTMIAQLHHLKHPTLKNEKTGKPLSIWDCYTVKPNAEGIMELQWTGGKRGVLKEGSGPMSTYKDMYELIPQEIAKLKKVYERMQGGYRKEEAAALEVYALGKVFIQLKKYAPQLIMNAVGSKKYVYELGYLKKTAERKDGEDVYEWMARLNEGRYRVLGKFLATSLHLSNNPDYRWSNMNNELKQHVIDAILTLSMWSLSYFAYIKMFDDDKDTDTYKRWWKMYLIDNLGQQYNPVELLRILEQGLQPVALSRAIKTTQAFAQLLVASSHLAMGDKEEALTLKGDLRGWNEMRKSIPLMSSYTDFIKRLEAGESITWDFRFNKYR